MALLAPPAPIPAAATSAERQRVRELSKYYSAVRLSATSPVNNKDLSSVTAPTGDDQPGPAQLSGDITLNALAQLGVYRLECERSFVSLIDDHNQHIIAEATRTVSLRDGNKHDPNDGVYLGVTTLDLVWAFCPHTIKLFTGQGCSYAINTPNITATRDRYIIRDFTQEDRFKDRPYVVGWPHVRFYAEVPLYSPSGYVLGSYCVVDDRPRTEFGDDHVAVLQEISDSIAQHLENVRIAQYHRRSELLVRGLTTFVKGDAHRMTSPPEDDDEATTIQGLQHFLSDAATEGGDLPGDESLLPKSTGKDAGTLGLESLSLSTEPTGEISPLLSRRHFSDATDATSLSSLNRLAVIERPLPPVERPLVEVRGTGTAESDASDRDSKAMVTVSESVGISQRISSIFSRASTLLRESLDLEGVVFLDACRSNSGIIPTVSRGNWEPLPKTANPEFSNNSLSQFSDSPPTLPKPDISDKLCDRLGSALRLTSDCDTEDTPHCALPESLLQQMITTYPGGNIFNLDDIEESCDTDPAISDEDSRTPHDSKQQIATTLAHHFPGVKSLLFCPLWDWNKSRWLAGTLVWTRDNARALQVEELYYFKAFGDSIISEVARVDWLAAEKSKSDFVSSISHELRSPLHGMLAGAELLYSTNLEPMQHDMVKMVETCGVTLLDTMNHLLDFAKINNLTTTKTKEGGREDETSLVTVFDLDTLIEEVTETLYIGQRFPGSLLHPAEDGSHSTHVSGTSSPHPRPSGEAGDEDLSVVIKIESQEGWKVKSVAGAWRRIVMNLLGNALKYTQSGFIEISLSRAFRPLGEDRPNRTWAHLSLTDTGIGISPDFLKHNLFSPFSQENSLSEGVGLGLSIVLQVVNSLSGHIDVKSEQGIGTQVDVFIPVDHTPMSSRDPVRLGSLEAAALFRGPHSNFSDPSVCLIGFNGYPDLGEAPTGILSSQDKRKLSIQSSLASIFSAWLGWTVSFAESLDKVSAGLAVIEEFRMKQMIAEGLWTRETLAAAGITSLILLGQEGSVVPTDGCIAGERMVRVTQPLGPRKIFRALEVLQMSKGNRHHRISSESGSTTITRPRQPSQASPPPQPSETLKALVLPVIGTETTADLPVPQPALFNVSNCHKGLRVLIVDDNDINLKILVTFMRKIGCHYDTASNGLIAVEKYKQAAGRFDYVLMDISMPVMDGLTATSKIRDHEQEHSLRPTIVLAVTGVASASMQQEALTSGVDDYLVKPISLKNLKKVMNIE